METRIVVINEANSWLADEQTTTPGQKATVRANADAPGTYYIGVMDLHGNSNYETPYSFRVTLVSQVWYPGVYDRDGRQCSPSLSCTMRLPSSPASPRSKS